MTSVAPELRVSTGIEGIDKMLHGGLIPGRPYVVQGPFGSGKTTFCIQFLQQGVRQGERALFVAIDEPPAELRENVRFLGWDVGKIRILDVHPAAKAYSRRVSLVEVAAQRAVGSLRQARADAKTESMKQMAPDLTPQSLQLMLRQELREVKYSRLVIDSLTSLKRLSGGEEDIDGGVLSLLRFLSEANLTSLIVTDLPEPTAGAALAFALGGCGSARGIAIASQEAAGVLSEKPGPFGRLPGCREAAPGSSHAPGAAGQGARTRH